MVLPALAVPVLGWSALAAGGAAGTTALIGTNDDWKKGLRLDPAARIQNEEFDRTTGQIKDYSFMDYLGSSLLGQDLRQLNEAAQKQSDTEITNRYSGTTKKLRNLLQAQGQLTPEILDMLKPQRFETADQFASNLDSVTQHINAINKAQASGVDYQSLIKNGGLLTQGQVDGLINKRDRDERNTRTAIEDRRYDESVTRQENQQNFNNSIVQSDREYRRWKEGEDDKWRRYQLDKDQADRALARRDRKDELLMTMQQRTLDRNFERERADRADARADRDKRTAMLMQMVQGLSKLGYGMAI